MSDINKMEAAITYGMSLIGAPYAWWFSGQLGEGAPAWASDEVVPPSELVHQRGVFCAGVTNLMLRSIGLPVPKNSPYNGGTQAYGLCYRLAPFDLNTIRRGDAVYRPYTSETD